MGHGEEELRTSRELQCQFPGTCTNERAFKRSGERHWLCPEHREHQNEMQRARYKRNLEAKKHNGPRSASAQFASFQTSSDKSGYSRIAYSTCVESTKLHKQRTPVSTPVRAPKNETNRPNSGDFDHNRTPPTTQKKSDDGNPRRALPRSSIPGNSKEKVRRSGNQTLGHLHDGA
ncbi:hypothetical protein ON010_g9572 [Phytophthora cinnamomi]|nr:hypothetical protein ON010_g9572 [Phytophthora cinnamomi]